MNCVKKKQVRDTFWNVLCNCFSRNLSPNLEKCEVLGSIGPTHLVSTVCNLGHCKDKWVYKGFVKIGDSIRPEGFLVELMENKRS